MALGFRVVRSVFSGRSDHQQVDVVETVAHGRVLLNDGIVMLSERDEFVYHEMIAHVPLFVHPAPRRVLIIGGGDGGAAREVLRHRDVERVVMVEIDALVIEACRRHLPKVAAAFDDPRLELIIGDGVAYAAAGGETFDVVIVDSSDPVGPARPLFDAGFYRSVANLLADDGILVTQAESPFYDASLQQRMLAHQRSLFPRLHLYLFPTLSYPGGLWSFGFASRGLCPVADFDARRLDAAGLALRYYNAAVHRAAFALPGLVLESLGGLLDPVPL
ncbi:MAG: polyamine aminopropyltransferase [Deltaproteobacteria bacterium]|nr:polyamine aminopropyltransferase [Deltaproteobacteria bacterium]